MNKKWLLKVILLAGLVIINQTSFAQSQKPRESDYARYIQSLLGGKLEYTIQSGRVDLLTDDHAIEIERAKKWKYAIGQSLWYALNTNRKPGIILLLEDRNEYKYAIQLITALEYAHLDDKIDVWIFPNDFKELMDAKE